MPSLTPLLSIHPASPYNLAAALLLSTALCAAAWVHHARAAFFAQLYSHVPYVPQWCAALTAAALAGDMDHLPPRHPGGGLGNAYLSLDVHSDHDHESEGEGGGGPRGGRALSEIEMGVGVGAGGPLAPPWPLPLPLPVPPATAPFPPTTSASTAAAAAVDATFADAAGGHPVPVPVPVSLASASASAGGETRAEGEGEGAVLATPDRAVVRRIRRRSEVGMARPDGQARLGCRPALALASIRCLPSPHPLTPAPFPCDDVVDDVCC